MSGTSYLPDSAYEPEPGQVFKGVGGCFLVDPGRYVPPLATVLMHLQLTCLKYGCAPVGTLEGGSHEHDAVPGVRVVWWGLTLARPTVAP